MDVRKVVIGDHYYWLKWPKESIKEPDKDNLSIHRSRVEYMSTTSLTMNTSSIHPSYDVRRSPDEIFGTYQEAHAARMEIIRDKIKYLLDLTIELSQEVEE